MNVVWIRFGAILMAVGVLMGAFGAHALKDKLDPAMMQVYQTGVFYHLVHALGLLLVGVFVQGGNTRVVPAGAFLMAGILLFSGSLYAMALTGATWLGSATPLGGMCFIVGWIILFFGF